MHLLDVSTNQNIKFHKVNKKLCDSFFGKIKKKCQS